MFRSIIGDIRMKFAMQPKNRETQVYLIKIGYKRDRQYTEQVIRLENYLKEEAQQYLCKLEEVCLQVSDLLSEKKGEVSDKILTDSYPLILCTGRKTTIPLSRELPNNIDLYEMESMWIENVTYFDEDGDAFSVTGWNVEKNI